MAPPLGTASSPMVVHVPVSSARHGTAVRVPPEVTRSRGRQAPENGLTPSNASATPSRSSSSASSQSRASSASHRSVGSSTGSVRDARPFDGVDHHDVRNSKKRPLRVLADAPSGRADAKQRRLGENGGDDDADSTDKRDHRRGERWGRLRSASPSPSSDRESGRLVRGYQAPPRPLSSSPGPLSRNPPTPPQHHHRTARMAEHMFQHSAALLHHAKLENDVRADNIQDEIRRQREKQDKYDRKMRSLERELKALDPLAAVAYARGESIALVSDQTRHESPSRQLSHTGMGDATQPGVEMLLPATVPEKEATIRASSRSHTTQLESFAEELRRVDHYVQTDYHEGFSD